MLRTQQWAGYNNSPLLLARTAQLIGQLRLHNVLHHELPPIEMPERGIGYQTRSAAETSIPLHDILRIPKLHPRTSLFGCQDPLAVLALLSGESPVEERLRLSFSTGLKLSVDREFRLLFAPQADSQLSAQLRAQGIDSVLCA